MALTAFLGKRSDLNRSWTIRWGMNRNTRWNIFPFSSTTTNMPNSTNSQLLTKTDLCVHVVPSVKERVHKFTRASYKLNFSIQNLNTDSDRRRGGVPEWLYNGGDCERPPQPFATGVGPGPCFISFPTRCTYSPYRFMQVPRNGDAGRSQNLAFLSPFYADPLLNSTAKKTPPNQGGFAILF